MNSKTPAELQLEFLRKLKERQKNSPAVPVGEEHGGSGKGRPAARKLKQGRTRGKAPAKGIPLSADAWARLRGQLLLTGNLRLNKALGNWAVELLMSVPPELQSATPELKREIFSKVRQWMESRGLK